MSDEYTNCIKGIDSNLNIIFIPMDEANSDYQEYLVWVEENKK